MSGKAIVLAEDNADDEELIKRSLKECNVHCPVIVARDGVEALDYLLGTGAHAGRDPAAVPQIAMLDLKLPKVDGLEVLRRIRANAATRRIPVVMLTSSAEERDIATAYDLGANSFVCKPVEYREFVQIVKQLVWYWTSINASPP